MTWLLENIPLWGWAIPAGGVLFLAWRYLGFRGMLAAAGAIGAAFLYRTGLKRGSAAERAKQAERDRKAREERLEMHREATDAEREAAAMTDEEARKEAMKWSRKL